MTPIIEGVDGVQKMSKSLGNAIGIHEAPLDMYGKLMSVSDDLMWRYWIFLTDLRQSEIEQMQAEVATGVLHPMEAKKRLARTIVAGFHSEAAARKADEDWALQFQQRNIEAVAEEVEVDFRRVMAGETASQVSVAKLLVELGLKTSRAEADRQVTAGVGVDGVTSTHKVLSLEHRPARIAIKVGKRAKIAVIK
jgi:tyrosyl-tRNA synthetase